MSTAEASISDIGARVGAVEDKMVFDTKPTDGSSNLLSSGAIYNELNKTDRTNLTENGNEYEEHIGHLWMGSSDSRIISQTEQKFSDGTNLAHRQFYSYISTGSSGATLRGSTSLYSDNTSTFYQYECEAQVVAHNSGYVTISASMNDDGNTLCFRKSKVAPQTGGVYDIGDSNTKFKDIYATNGTIQTSDATEKKNIEDLDTQLVRDIIMSLRPVSFKFVDGTSDRTHYGLVAQEVEETVNGLGISNQDFAPLIKSKKIETDEEGNEAVLESEYVYGLRYAEFVGILIKMCQNLQNEVDELKVRLGGE